MTAHSTVTDAFAAGFVLETSLQNAQAQGVSGIVLSHCPDNKMPTVFNVMCGTRAGWLISQLPGALCTQRDGSH